MSFAGCGVGSEIDCDATSGEEVVRDGEAAARDEPVVAGASSEEGSPAATDEHVVMDRAGQGLDALERVSSAPASTTRAQIRPHAPAGVDEEGAVEEAGTSVETIVARASKQGVRPTGAAEEDVVSRPDRGDVIGDNEVGAATAFDSVAFLAAKEKVDGPAARDAVSSSTSIDGIEPPAAEEPIPPASSFDPVQAGAAADPVAAQAAAEIVKACIATQDVSAEGSGELVIPVAAGEAVGPVGTLDRVVAALAENSICLWAAAQVVRSAPTSKDVGAHRAA